MDASPIISIKGGGPLCRGEHGRKMPRLERFHQTSIPWEVRMEGLDNHGPAIKTRDKCGDMVRS